MSAMTHCVYFWLDDSLTEEQKEEFAEEGLATLPAIDVVSSGTYGVPAATPSREGVTDHSFDFWLSLTFDTVEEQEAYQTHPEHDVFVERFSPWFKTVKVYDGTIQ